jgi:glycosyltransferase involved in cell wall biosynthesis
LNNHHLHIVSFDVPYPANYGGVIDVYYKIKALHKKGVKVILHCFQYGREAQNKLEDVCFEVHYYQRSEKLLKHFNLKPYIVNSRMEDTLIARLLEDDYPILFEGLHSTYYLPHKELKNRKKWVRIHNLEHEYYDGLANVEQDVFKKMYFKIEAFKLKKYEAVLRHADGLCAISNNDEQYLSQKFDAVHYLQAFHPNETLMCLEGKGDYALYHGNLSVGENQEAVRYLVTEVFAHINIPLVIAGGGAPSWMFDLIKGYKHITLDKQDDMEHIKQLLLKAQINVLPTFQPTGIKLKLLFALFNGRFCVVNSFMVSQTGLEPYCVIADTAEAMQKEIERVFTLPFQAEDIKNREGMLSQFSTELGAVHLMKLLWNL